MIRNASPKPILPLNDWSHHPFIVIWEVTRACALACRHCRASAIPHRHPLELTTEQGYALIDDIASSGTPMLVLTGGDPALRPDLKLLVRHAAEAGLRVGLSPSATPRLTRRLLFALAEAGASAVSLSVDGATAEAHDLFRGVPRTFARTLRIAEWVKEAGMALQINTTVSRFNHHDLPAIRDLVSELGASTWSLFFLVPTGRATLDQALSAWEHEAVYRWLWEISSQVNFAIKTTEGQSYRRFALLALEEAARAEEREDLADIRTVAEEGRADSVGGRASSHGADGRAFPDGGHTGSTSGRAVPAPAHFLSGINDGRGFCFINHVGNVCPSGFLEISAGNVRQRPFSRTYRESPLFQVLRDWNQLKGKCGRCPFRAVCGGSRARAYHMTGDMLAADPTCAYVPD